MPQAWIGHSDGGWTVKDSGRVVAGPFRTQEEAHQAGRKYLNSFPPGQGGELIIQGEDGKIRLKDTINHADPRGNG